jgi:hypothetical protein
MGSGSDLSSGPDGGSTMRGLLRFFASFYFSALHPIKDKYDKGM